MATIREFLRYSSYSLPPQRIPIYEPQSTLQNTEGIRGN